MTVQGKGSPHDVFVRLLCLECYTCREYQKLDEMARGVDRAMGYQVLLLFADGLPQKMLDWVHVMEVEAADDGTCERLEGETLFGIDVTRSFRPKNKDGNRIG